MSFRFFNPNPRHRRSVGDCSVRAIAKALDISWESAYIDQITIGYDIGDMPSSNVVIAILLRKNGFRKATIPNDCQDCYTISEFARNNPIGRFIVGTGTHVVAIVSGNYFDTWDSGDENLIYVWYKDRKPIF